MGPSRYPSCHLNCAERAPGVALLSAMSETLMNEKNDLLIRAGRTAHHQWVLDITPEQAGWRFSGIRIVELAPGGSQELATGEDEVLVLPLSGSCSVQAGGSPTSSPVARTCS